MKFKTIILWAVYLTLIVGLGFYTCYPSMYFVEKAVIVEESNATKFLASDYGEVIVTDYNVAKSKDEKFIAINGYCTMNGEELSYIAVFNKTPFGDVYNIAYNSAHDLVGIDSDYLMSVDDVIETPILKYNLDVYRDTIEVETKANVSSIAMFGLIFVIITFNVYKKKKLK